ncbi:MAG: YlbF family regulator [Gemmatimonadales bacterium]
MIFDEAVALGRSIGRHDDFQALRRAEKELAEATELKEKVDRLQQLGGRAERQVVEGEQVSDETKRQYETLLAEVQADPRYQRWVAAQSNFEKLMLRVHEHIAEGMHDAAESRIITLD